MENALALVGGSAVSILYALYTYTEYFRYGMILLILTIGALIGPEIPILTRILRQYDSFKIALSNALSLDYCGSLIAALLFPYVLLPFLGMMHTSVITGLINWAVGLIVVLVQRTIKPFRVKAHLCASGDCRTISFFTLGFRPAFGCSLGKRYV